MKLFYSLAAAGLIFSANPVLASDLTILDCNNNIKAIESVESSTLSNLDVIVDELNTNGLVLMPADMNKSGVISASVKRVGDQASADFKAVEPGTWSLCDTNKEYVSFSVSKISHGEVAGTQYTSAVIGGSAVAALSAAAIGFGSASSGNSNGSSLAGSLGGSVGESSSTSEAPAVTQPAISFDDSDYPLGSPAAPLEPYTPLSPFK